MKTDLAKFFEALNVSKAVNLGLQGYPDTVRKTKDPVIVDEKDVQIQRLQNKLDQLQQKCDQNTKDYYKELMFHRQNIERQKKSKYEQSRVGDEHLSVKYFTGEDHF
jgi:hypothetical protein